jgi:hypothetical protein
MNSSEKLARQLAASLDMLTKAVESANNEVWIASEPPFWQTSFHIVSSVDFYFTTFNPDIGNPAEDYRFPEDLQIHAKKSFFDYKTDEAVTQEEIKKFIETTRGRLRSYFNNNIEDQFKEPSGFPWLPMSKEELIVYNIRHLMEHTAILNQILKQHNISAANWVGLSEL